MRSIVVGSLFMNLFSWFNNTNKSTTDNKEPRLAEANTMWPTAKVIKPKPFVITKVSPQTIRHVIIENKG